jgi:RHS repeat-associated protein
MTTTSMRLITPILVGLFIFSPALQAETVTYEYDPNGNVLVRQSPSRADTAGYDALNRQTLDQAGDGLLREFRYDPNGNRTRYQVETFTETLAYAPNTNQLVQRGPQSITRDSAGNITNDGQFTYVYNSAGRLAQVLRDATVIATYTYNAQGQRTRKVTAQGTTLYQYDLSGQLIAETTATGQAQRDYVWAESKPIAQIDVTSEGDKVTYLHTDHLNTPRVATDATGTVVWMWNGDAFGSLLPYQDADGNGQIVMVNLRMPGQYFDPESGLHYNWNRYYDPKLGRYITSDPIGLQGGLNTYAYALNNPLFWIDPNGTIILPPGVTKWLKCVALLGCLYGDPKEPGSEQPVVPPDRPTNPSTPTGPKGPNSPGGNDKPPGGKPGGNDKPPGGDDKPSGGEGSASGSCPDNDCPKKLGEVQAKGVLYTIWLTCTGAILWVAATLF